MDDQTIIDLFWKRSELAIAETEKKYGELCKNIIYRIVLNSQDAEECVNDTYYGLWTSIPPASPTVFSAFIAKIARNTAMKRITYRNARKRAAGVSVSFEELENCVSSHHNVEKELDAQLLAQCLERFLQETDYESRNIFLRRYWFFDSISDIARRFSMTESKVKSNLFRTRKNLKKFLAKEGYIYE